MKRYRCVFSYPGGNTTIEIAAEDGEQAIAAASAAISAGDYDRVEVWESERLLITRTTPRAWNALGGTEQPKTTPLYPSRPRRTTISFASSLKALGLANAKVRWQRLIARKG